MASLKLFVSVIVLASLISFYAPACSSFDDRGINVDVLESQKVNLALYYETLCPGCADFIVNDLTPMVLDDDFMSIVNLKLVPFGNALLQGPNKTTVCQHGADECYLNSIEACALHHWPDVKRYIRFIHCLEKKIIEGKMSKKDAWIACCKECKMSPKVLGSCYESGYGQKLILENAIETNSLVPPHQYVPWVVVDGEPLKEHLQEFVSYVCNAYKGSPKPKACTTHSQNRNSAQEANSSHQVCHKGEARRGT